MKKGNKGIRKGKRKQYIIKNVLAFSSSLYVSFSRVVLASELLRGSKGMKDYDLLMKHLLQSQSIGC